MRLACGLIVAVICCGCSRAPDPPSSPPTTTQTASTPKNETKPVEWPPLPHAESPYLNTRSDAGYVGSAACTRCHRAAAETYHHTAMSVSMLPVNIAQEPPDGQYDHSPSGRHYTVERRGDQMWHIESRMVDDILVVLSEYPVKYVVGSGRHSRTYLVEAEGFLVESPITWYSEQKRWAMSPGYDRPDHLGFERATGQGCLECHAGRSAPKEKSLHRMTVFEAAIGCERCHGPGSLHVEKHRDWNPELATPSGSATDLTIVNPADLTRELAEAICQQCHLRSSATILSRDHDFSDFRPGLPLTQFRHDYRLQVDDTPLTVVSHVEQMHLSRCYQKSESMTCRTCHNPHAERDVERRPQHFNAICANCHQERTCSAPATERSQTSPVDNCTGCHMPRGDTEIPHLAFTHHRIERKAKQKSSTTDSDAVPTTLGELQPLFDLSGWSQPDRQRSLGIAYAELAGRVEASPVAETYRRRAWALLVELDEAGYRDPTATVALAQLAFGFQLPQAEIFARRALADPRLAGQDRCTALFLSGDAALQQQQPAAAVPFIQELTTLRRHPVDWLMRAQAERAAGKDFIPSLETAVRIGPQLKNIHQVLAQHFQSVNDHPRAERHRRLAQ